MLERKKESKSLFYTF